MHAPRNRLYMHCRRINDRGNSTETPSASDTAGTLIIFGIISALLRSIQRVTLLHNRRVMDAQLHEWTETARMPCPVRSDIYLAPERCT